MNSRKFNKYPEGIKQNLRILKNEIMSTFRQILYQIVFSTKNRIPSLEIEYQEELYKYIWGIIKNKKCKLYRINGVEDHIHIVSDLHPTIALSDFIKDIKVASSKWMKTMGKFPKFDLWQEGYGAFTYSWRDKNSIIEYVKNQKYHHKKIGFIKEYKNLLKEHGIDFDEKYLL